MSVSNRMRADAFSILMAVLLLAVIARAESETACSTTLPFYCNNRSKCIHRNAFCDGKPDCDDESDEISYNSTIHEDGLPCRNPRSKLQDKECYLPEKYKCDHELDCRGGFDECGCQSTFQCGYGCALRIHFCDGSEECEDGTDEKPYNRTEGGFQCQVTKKHSTTSCTLPDVHVCDGYSDCEWGTDECFCDFSEGKVGTPTIAFSSSKCFRCFDGTMVIPNHYVCDGKVHCKDLSDECLCSMEGNNSSSICSNVCTGANCKCPGKLECVPRVSKNETSQETICVDPESICNEEYDCKDGTDERFCWMDEQYFHCADGSKKVKNSLICDGIPHCEDASDEFQCHETMYVCDLYTQKVSGFLKWTHLKGWNDTQNFPPLNRTSIDIDWWTEKKIRWTFYYPYYAKPCDGIPLCPDGEEECNRVNETRNPNCEKRPGFCDFVEEGLSCPNSGSRITGYEVCDGQPTCNDTAPETSRDEMGCPNRFYCKNFGSTRLPIHIPAENECDGIAECDDESDELECSNQTHFYCSGSESPRFIPIAQKCDRRKDCKNGDDECASCSNDPFSSDDKLIRSRVLIGFLWIIGSMSTLGNIVIIIHQIVNIYKIRNGKNQVALKNRILVLNLSSADFLLGVYLISLGIKDATVDKYCLHDQEWRSSSSCSSLGAIAVVGTEASVLILMIMTSHRLDLVFRPFGAQKMSAIIISLIGAWTIAILLAAVPLSVSAREYFLSCVWFRNHRYLGYACRDKITGFTQKLIALEGPNKTFSKVVGPKFTWASMLDAQKTLNDSYVAERYYGYYSAHSVCLPRFFPDVDRDESWKYSMFLLLLNFVGFIYILISYIFIYKQSTSNRMSKKKEDRTAALQRKVTRIVLTDFCCWMPICIMAFINVAGTDVGPTAYAVTAIILLPINSAMNPFLYSSLLDIIWDQCLPLRKRISRTAMGRSIVESLRKRRDKRNGGSLATSVTNMPVTVYGGESSVEGNSSPVKERPHKPNDDIPLAVVATAKNGQSDDRKES